jgi:hypothetical protein
MVADIVSVFAAPRSVRVFLATLSARRINATFADVRKELAARTVHATVRDQGSSSVVWSLWIGRFEKRVPWLLDDRFEETRYAFLLILEHNGYVGILGNNVGDVASDVADDRLSYQKLLALHSDKDTEVEALSTRSLRAARTGVTRSTQKGRHLEKALSRAGANQVAPLQIALRQAEQSWRVAPGTGRVAVVGKRISVDDLCSWFATTCHEIEQAKEPSEFIKAFAHPIALGDLPADVTPSALQLDSSVIDDLLDLGASLRRMDAELEDAEVEGLRQLVKELWLVELPRTQEDEEAGVWRLKVNGAEVGQLTVRTKKISLSSSVLKDVEVLQEDGTTETLNRIFNDGDQPLRLTFSDVSYAYAAGQLFRDHRLLANRGALLDMLSDDLPPDAADEKGGAGNPFSPESLFGFVVDRASSGDDYLVCDDLGTEWADFIGVSTVDRRVTFYHCKGGRIDVGASGLQELISQAAKNLGYLTASTAELGKRDVKWEGTWGTTSTPRLQRGGDVSDFVAAFARAVSAPQATRRVTLVTSALSKAAVAEAFAGIDTSSPTPEAFHVLWLLWVFVDQCRSIGAVPQIVCRP